VYVVCYAGSGLRDELITPVEETERVCVCVCVRERERERVIVCDL
jgi:hypothetical protein